MYHIFVLMFDLRMINMSSECEYDWYWKISARSIEYGVCDSFASFTHQQTSYSGSAGSYFRYQSIQFQITYTYDSANTTTCDSLRGICGLKSIPLHVKHLHIPWFWNCDSCFCFINILSNSCAVMVSRFLLSPVLTIIISVFCIYPDF